MTTVVVFDLDDTLYPERAFIESAFRAVGQRVQAEWGVPEFGHRCLELFAAGVRGNTFQRAYADAAGEVLSEHRAAELLRMYRDHAPPSLPWHPDALEAVKALHGRVPLALLSDGFLPTQAHKARALGVECWISDPVFTESLGREHWKPSPKGFELIMSRHPGHRFMYVADNSAKDFIAPRALGWRTVQVLRPGATYAEVAAPPEACAAHVVDSLRSLPALALTRSG